MARQDSDSGEALSIAHLISSNFFGGPEKQIVELSRRLHGDGWPVIVGSFRENRERVEIVDRAAEVGLETFLLETRSRFHPGSIGQLREVLNARRVQLLITHGYKANLIGKLATRGQAVYQLPIVRGYTGEDWKIRIYERLDRRVLRGFSQVASVSAATREMLVAHGLRRERIEVLHNAVDCERPVTAVDLRRAFGLAPDSLVLVAAGRLSPEKAHRDLVSAMASVAAAEPRAVALIFGAGSQQVALERQIQELGLSQRVRLLGFRSDVLACLAGADLVVNPSLTEGLPNVVLEALAMQTAVVATAVGGVAELIEDGVSGWLVEPGAPARLAATLLGALADPARRAAIAAAGRARVEREFSFSRQQERFAALCRRTLAGA